MVAQKGSIIAFRLDANHERGMGHLYRMMTLAAAFRAHNHACVFILRKNRIAQSIIQKTPYNYVHFATTDSEEAIIETFLSAHPQSALWIFDVLDTRFAWIDQIHEYGIPVVCFDDQEGGPLAADLIINPIAGCWKDGTVQITQDTIVLEGPRYALLEPSLTTYQKQPKYSERSLKVGITLGGSDTYGASVKIAGILPTIYQLEAYFFLGPHFSHTDDLMNIVPRLPFSCRLISAPRDLHKELAAMDAIICGGGQTLFELAAMGMPFAAVANERHEEYTIAYFKRHGACVDLGCIHDSVNGSRLTEFLINCKQRAENITVMQAAAASLVDGKGAHRCYESCARLMSAFAPLDVCPTAYRKDHVL